MQRFTNLCAVLCRGHANLLCAVSIFVYVRLKRALGADLEEFSSFILSLGHLLQLCSTPTLALSL